MFVNSSSEGSATVFTAVRFRVQVRVAESLIPGAGEGLFATRDIGEGELVAFYGGFVLARGEYEHTARLDHRGNSDTDRDNNMLG